MKFAIALLLLSSCAFAGTTYDFCARAQDLTHLNNSAMTVARGVAGLLDLKCIGNSGHPVQVYSSFSVGAAQFAQAIVDRDAGPGVRIQSDGSGYYVRAGSANANASIVECTGASCAVLASSSGVTLNDTDVVRLEVTGSNLTAKIFSGWDHGTVRATINATDSTYSTGSVGWYVPATYGRGVSAWIGGDLADAPTSRPDATRTDYYVATSATATGDGSISAPYRLDILLAREAWLADGARVWLRAGTYAPDVQVYDPTGTHGYVMSRSYTTGVLFAPYPNEAVTISPATGYECHKSTALDVAGSHITIRGFTLNADISDCRIGQIPGSNPVNKPASLVALDGTFNTLERTTLKNGGDCMDGNDGAAYGNAVIENVFQNCGWDSPDRLHGSATYNRNSDATYPHRVERNLSRDHSYQNYRFTGGSGYLRGIEISENVAFGNTIPLIGTANSPADMTQWTFFHNWFNGFWGYDRPTPDSSTFTRNTLLAGASNMPGRNTGYSGYDPSPLPSYTVTDNRFYAASGNLLTQYFPTGMTPTYTGNTYHGNQSWSFGGSTYTSFASFASASGETGSFTSGAPTTNWTWVSENNPYDSCRVVVKNWESLTEQAVDVSACPLRSGDTYQILDAWNLPAGVVASGTYGGSTITLPLNLTGYDGPDYGAGYATACWRNSCSTCIADLGIQSGAGAPAGACTPGFAGSSLYVNTSDNAIYYCDTDATWERNTDYDWTCSNHAGLTYARDDSLSVFIIRRTQSFRTATVSASCVTGETATLYSGSSPNDMRGYPAISLTCSGGQFSGSGPAISGRFYQQLCRGGACSAITEVR